MVKFEFYLSDEDTDRLFLLKEQAKKSDMTGNEYAKEILSVELWKRCPNLPKMGDE